MIRNVRTLRGAPVLVAMLVLAGPAFAQFEMLKNLGKTAQEPGKTIAYFQIKGALTETPSNIPPLFGPQPPMSLKALLTGLKEARTDTSVVAVVLDLEEAAMGLAQIEELHDAMSKFSAVDKEVYVHADQLSTMTYALASGAGHISLVPTGDLWLTGLYGETPYLRGALDKLGVVPDFEHMGDYKTGPEPLTHTGPSQEAREMNKWLFDGLYEGLVALIAEGRELTPDKVRELIDNGPYSAEDALAAGLIDSVKHRQDFASDLTTRYGKGVTIAFDYGEAEEGGIPEDFFGMMQFFMQMLNPSPKTFSEPTIAVVYVEGMIQTGEPQPSPFGMAEGAFSTTIRKALDKAAEEDLVKAVVMRVDSPGGSALASEIILHAAKRVAARKPLIVSMGNVAASGGYYVTCASNTIFADANTITASIGVFGGKLVTTQAWDKLGINWHATERGAMAGLMSTSEPFSERERAKIRDYMENVYTTFTGHVLEARKNRLTQPLEEIAGGRVYTGAQALKRGLVDKLGGLDDAIRFAADEARISEYDIRVIPEPPTIFDLLMGDQDEEEIFGASPAARLSLTDHPLFTQALPLIARVDPLRVRAIVRMLQRLELVHAEGVILATPSEYIWQ